MNKLRKKFDLENFVSELQLDEQSLEFFKSDYKIHSTKKQIFEALESALQRLFRDLNSEIISSKPNFNKFYPLIEGVSEVFIFIYNCTIFDNVEKRELTQKLQIRFLNIVRKVIKDESSEYKTEMFKILYSIKLECWNPYFEYKYIKTIFEENSVDESKIENTSAINDFGSKYNYELFNFLTEYYHPKSDKMKFSQIFRFLKFDIAMTETSYITYIQRNFGVKLSRVSQEIIKEQTTLKSLKSEFETQS